jgi:hypothetical protein
MLNAECWTPLSAFSSRPPLPRPLTPVPFSIQSGDSHDQGQTKPLQLAPFRSSAERTKPGQPNLLLQVKGVYPIHLLYSTHFFERPREPVRSRGCVSEVRELSATAAVAVRPGSCPSGSPCGGHLVVRRRRCPASRVRSREPGVSRHSAISNSRRPQ